MRSQVLAFHPEIFEFAMTKSRFPFVNLATYAL
jgi:hypothetical protein